MDSRDSDRQRLSFLHSRFGRRRFSCKILGLLLGQLPGTRCTRTPTTPTTPLTRHQLKTSENQVERRRLSTSFDPFQMYPPKASCKIIFKNHIHFISHRCHIRCPKRFRSGERPVELCASSLKALRAPPPWLPLQLFELPKPPDRLSL